MLDSSEKNNKSAFIKKIHLRKTKRFSTPCLIATLLWELPDDDIIHQPVLANKRPHCGRTALHQSINPLYYGRTWHRTSSLSWCQLEKRWLNWIQAPRFHSPGTFAQATSLFDRRKKGVFRGHSRHEKRPEQILHNCGFFLVLQHSLLVWLEIEDRTLSVLLVVGRRGSCCSRKKRQLVKKQ